MIIYDLSYLINISTQMSKTTASATSETVDMASLIPTLNPLYLTSEELDEYESLVNFDNFDPWNDERNAKLSRIKRSIPDSWTLRNLEKIVLSRNFSAFIKTQKFYANTLIEIYNFIQSRHIEYVPLFRLDNIIDDPVSMIRAFPKHFYWIHEAHKLDDDCLIEFKEHIPWDHVSHSQLSRRVIKECKDYVDQKRLYWNVSEAEERPHHKIEYDYDFLCELFR